jgi:hypothetical protein
MTNIYSYFEDIVCINLDISVDRRKHAEFYFDKLNIPARFYTATKHSNGGMYGCFHSHIEVLKDAYFRGLNNILVFEDDFLPTASYSEEKLQKAIDFMKTNDDWDIMYLGYNVIKDDIAYGISTIFDAKYITEDIVQYNPYCSHALCYSKRAISKIMKTYEDCIGIVHVDMYMALYAGLTNYCMVPMLFDQNFYFEHNNEAGDICEVILRALFPLLAFTKLNHKVSVLKYIFNKYQNITHYIYLFFFSLILYRVKTALLFSVQKKYILFK